MNTLWLFNPENDIALGNNLRHFTPPRNAALLRRYGALLPLWMAEDGDCIFTGEDTDTIRVFIANHGKLTGKSIELLSRDNISSVKKICPWGWSNAIINELARTGLSLEQMPDSNQIEDIRKISHRHSSIIITRALAARGIDTVIPTEVASAAELTALLHGGNDYVLKSPWSSSGRGVLHSNSMSRDRLIEHCDGIIRHQGSVLAEPLLNKTLDFAMLFEAKGGKVEYVGLSVFDTGNGGNYSGNIVASEEYLTKKLTEYIDYADLKIIKDTLTKILAGLIGNAYEGICGVDMLIYRDATGSKRIAPCIELNLRCTMGYVAHCIYKNLLSGNTVGFMNISYKGKNHSCAETAKRPIFDTARHLTEGTLPLVPPNDYFDISLTVR